MQIRSLMHSTIDTEVTMLVLLFYGHIQPFADPTTLLMLTVPVPMDPFMHLHGDILIGY